MSQDRFSPFLHGHNAPAIGSYVITPSDSADLDEVVRAITIGTAGTLAWQDPNGTVYSTAQLPAGTYAVRAARILATGTTASQITGWV